MNLAKIIGPLYELFTMKSSLLIVALGSVLIGCVFGCKHGASLYSGKIALEVRSVRSKWLQNDRCDVHVDLIIENGTRHSVEIYPLYREAFQVVGIPPVYELPPTAWATGPGSRLTGGMRLEPLESKELTDGYVIHSFVVKRAELSSESQKLMFDLRYSFKGVNSEYVRCQIPPPFAVCVCVCGVRP